MIGSYSLSKGNEVKIPQPGRGYCAVTQVSVRLRNLSQN